MCWAKPHIREHDEQGANQNLIAGLRRKESDEIATFHFVYILRKIDPVIARFDANFRKSISSASRLNDSIHDIIKY